MNDRKGDWMQTFSGGMFWPIDPWPDEVDIVDIAHALSNICRYGGHCRSFYSVAEHSALMCVAAPPEHRRWALLHDAAEAYVVDVPRPLKRFLPGYAEIEDRVLRAIADRFDLPWPMPEAVKILDNRMLVSEQRAIMGRPPAPWGIDVEPLDVPIRCLDPETARRSFMTLWESL